MIRPPVPKPSAPPAKKSQLDESTAEPDIEASYKMFNDYKSPTIRMMLRMGGITV